MNSNYYINLKDISIDELKNDIIKRDLIPSQKILLEKIGERFEYFKNKNIKNLYDLQEILKTKNDVESYAEKSNISFDYLIVLRREVNSYHPAPNNFKDIPGLNNDIIVKLDKLGIKNTYNLFGKVLTKKDRSAFSKLSNIDIKNVIELTVLSDLSRVKWLGPILSKLMLDAGIDNLDKLSDADKNGLYLKLVKANEIKKYTKAKFKESDIEICINFSKYVPRVIEY